MASTGSQWFANVASSGYAVGNSAIFEDGSSEFLRQTLSAAGNQKTYSYSVWFKRGNISSVQYLLRRSGGSTYSFIRINANNTLSFYNEKAGVSAVSLIPNQVFRDTTAWYHLLLASDQTQSTSSNRAKLYINGVQVTSFSTESYGIAQNQEGELFDATAVDIGNGNNTEYWDGYMSEIVYIDGTALTPTSFGEFDSYGVWKPIDVTGLTFGTNGFYLPFSNSGLLGDDKSKSNGLIDPSLGTVGGDMTQEGGNAAAFDGNYSQSSTQAARKGGGSSTAFISKDFGSGVTKTITGLRIFGCTDQGFHSDNNTTTVTVTLTGSNNDSDYTALGNFSFTDPGNNTPQEKMSGFTASAFRYFKITLSGMPTSGGHLIGEIELYEEASPAGGNNLSNHGGVSQSGDSPTSNVSVLNPLWTSSTLSDGNLKASNSATAYNWAISTIAIPSTGKWVFEGQSSNANGSNKWVLIGICQMGNHNVKAGLNYIYALNVGNGEVIKNSSAVATVTAPTTSLIRVEYNASTDQITFFDDNSQVHQATAGLTGEDSLHFFVAPLATSGTADMTATFTGLTNTPTADFLELKASNFSEPSVPDGSAQHQAILWSGNSSSQTVTQAGNDGFTPDWWIIKSRSFANGANSYDIVRGATKGLATFDDGSEDTESNMGSPSIADGKGTLSFTGGGSAGDINSSGRTYVGLTWNAGGSTASNSDGSITSSVRASSTSGTAIGTYTGTGSAATVGHGLGLVPRMIWVKKRSGTHNWACYSAPAGNAFYQRLDTEAARAEDNGFWSSTTPTTTVFSINDVGAVNEGSGTFVFYAMADVEGYQKIGQYTGNGNADGPVITTGFKPQYVMVKSTTAGSTNWEFFCDIIEPFNSVGNQNFFNIANAEASNDHEMDWLANGFKLRDTSSSVNSSSATYLYWAIAKYPFGGTCPAPAR